MVNKLVLLAFVAVLLIGCNTIHGMGRDVEAGGDAISRAAK